MLDLARALLRRTTDIGGASTIDVERYPHFRRNYLLGIANGALFDSGMVFFGRSTVIPAFMAALHAPAVVISIASLLMSIGWHFPQLFAAPFVAHRRHTLSIYAWACVVRLTGVALAILGAVWAENGDRSGAIWMFLLGFGLFAFAGGFAGLIFLEIVAKTCPKERRGTYFGWRAILSGIAGLFIGVEVIDPVVRGQGGEHPFTTLFTIGAVLIALGFAVFIAQREPDVEVRPAERTVRQQLAAAWQVLRTDRQFRRFVLLRSFLMLWLAGVPFYILMAQDLMKAGDEHLGIFTSWEFAGLVVSNLVWGAISNRAGNRLLLLLACSLGLVVSIVAMLVAAEVVAIPLGLFGVIFLASAAVDSGTGTGGINYGFEIIPEGERPTYVGLMNTTLAIALALAAGAGAVRDLAGYTGVYALTGMIALVSLAMVIRMPEPRRQERG